MKVTLFTRYKTVRLAMSLLLVLLIGTKVVLPVFSNLKSAGKETSAISGQNDNDGEKKTENNPLPEKEKEFANVYNDTVTHFIGFTDIIHHTVYKNTYLAVHSLSIHTPPPDLYLQYAT